MIKNVEKMYSLTSPIVFVKTYKVTLNNDTVIYVPLDPANYRLPSNSGMD
jgi:hypothetical protein